MSCDHNRLSQTNIGLIKIETRVKTIWFINTLQRGRYHENIQHKGGSINVPSGDY